MQESSLNNNGAITMSKLDQQIQNLQQKRLKLEEDLLTLKRKRNEDILKVLDSFPDGSIPSKTIIGILLDGIKVAMEDSQKAEVWLKAGETFCKSGGGKRSFKNTKLNTEKTAQDVSKNER